MTWNIRSLRDDRSAVVRILQTCAPDVLYVQEAPRFLRAQSKLAALARAAGLVVASGGRPAAGVALLTTLRVEVNAPSSHLLTKTPRLHQRGLATAELSLGDRRFVAGSLHLGLDADERQLHASEIARWVGAGPSVIAGDFNEGSNGPAWQALATGHQDVGAAANLATFSTTNPRRRIDTILVPADWQVTPVSPLEILHESDLRAATDHRPVIADVVGWGR
ncbi:MAG: endonuclease/exonuclease/phosphatase family protein [Actinomycetia bacterium]|nr:endonuclease/exonuclease/phosphatase family protein [Actinomycetes bacterium]